MIKFTSLFAFFALVSLPISSNGFAASFLEGKKLEIDKSVTSKLQPHKALYDIQLKSSKSGSQILDISGKMYYGWEATCEGWTTDHRFSLLYEYADTAPVEVKSDFTTFENYEGSKLDFNSRRKRNDKLFEEFRGQATINKDGESSANYTIPEDMSHDLPSNTYLPVVHTLKLLENANNNKRFFNAVLFDGSDEEGAYEVNAFVGKSLKSDVSFQDTQEIDSKLLNNRTWPMRLAFFPVEQKSPEPEYEMQIKFHENGIVSDMVIDYEDFSVTQKLVALEAFSWPECP